VTDREFRRTIVRDFSIKDAIILSKLLEANDIMKGERAGEFTTALAEIRESAGEIFDVQLPKLCNQLESKSGDTEDTIRDIREECSHINYHVKEAKLPADVDPWTQILKPETHE
jgi:hypothetical protein